MDDIFTNNCSPPAESGSHTECTVTHWDRLYTPWAPSGSPVLLRALYKPAGIIVFTKGIITYSNVVKHAVSLCDFKEVLSWYESAEKNKRMCKLSLCRSS